MIDTDNEPKRYVCFDCFKNCYGYYAISAFINSRAVANQCSYCSRREQQPIAANIHAVARFIEEGLVRLIPPNPDGAAELLSVAGRAMSQTEVLRKLWPGLPHELVSDLADRLEQDVIYYALLAKPHAHKDLAYTWKQFSHEVKHECRFVFYKKRARSRYPAYKVLDEIGTYIRQLDMIKTLPRRTEIFRARLHSGTIPHSAGALGAPPPESASQSRMSPAGIPMFYGASDKLVALKEIITFPTRKRKVTFGKFRNRKALPILDLSTPPEPPCIFDRARFKLRPAAVFMQEFAAELSKPILKDGEQHIGYVPSQVVAEYLRHVFRLRNGRRLGGIKFRSSKAAGNCLTLFCTAEDCGDPWQESAVTLILDSAETHAVADILQPKQPPPPPA